MSIPLFTSPVFEIELQPGETDWFFFTSRKCLEISHRDIVRGVPAISPPTCRGHEHGARQPNHIATVSFRVFLFRNALGDSRPGVPSRETIRRVSLSACLFREATCHARFATRNEVPFAGLRKAIRFNREFCVRGYGRKRPATDCRTAADPSLFAFKHPPGIGNGSNGVPGHCLARYSPASTTLDPLQENNLAIRPDRLP